MEDKIIEVFKKYSKSVDTEYNVYNCLIEEDWSNIAQELVKLFCQPAVMPSLPNGKKVLKALKEWHDSFTPEELKEMFGNERR